MRHRHQGVPRATEPIEDFGDPSHEPVGRIGRRRRRLRRDQLAGLHVERDYIGERPTRVDADPDVPPPRHGTSRTWYFLAMSATYRRAVNPKTGGRDGGMGVFLETE
jgi:hypothetical protein